MEKLIRDNLDWEGVHTVCQCGSCGEYVFPSYEHICKVFNSYPVGSVSTEKPKNRILSRDVVIHTMERYFVDGKIDFKTFYQVMMNIPCYDTTRKKKGGK